MTWILAGAIIGLILGIVVNVRENRERRQAEKRAAVGRYFELLEGSDEA